VGTDTEQLRQEIDRTRGELGRDVDALADKVAPSKIAERRMESVKGTVSDVKDRVMGTASDATHEVGDAASSVASTTRGTTRRVTRAAQGNPLATGLLAFAAGWLVSGLIPASEKEKQLAGQAKHTLEESGALDKAAEVAQEVREGMSEPLHQAAEQVTQSARESAEHVKETASEHMPSAAGSSGSTPGYPA
jgi:F0F1-type ATP synthase membrane subunit b/b'